MRPLVYGQGMANAVAAFSSRDGLFIPRAPECMLAYAKSMDCVLAYLLTTEYYPLLCNLTNEQFNMPLARLAVITSSSSRDRHRLQVRPCLLSSLRPWEQA